jgi:geranylgeranyl pyrophosphate synthase
MGKETQMDQKNKKITYPVLMGILETETHISTLKETILRQIEDLRLKSDFLVETVKFLSVREY